MPLNIIDAMVIMLILVVVVILMVSSSTRGFFDITKKIDTPADTSECQIRCHQCCDYEGSRYPDDCGTSGDDKFKIDGCDCNC